MTGLPPDFKEVGKCEWLCALEEKGNEINSSLSATESGNDENKAVTVDHFVEGKESSLDLSG